MVLADTFSIDFNLKIHWKPVLSDDSNQAVHKYYFPNRITTFMNKTYMNNAVYRWDIYRETPEDSRIIYVGETVDIIRRIRGYLNPGSSQKTSLQLLLTMSHSLFEYR